MSYMNGPRSTSSQDSQAWQEQVAQAMEDAHRRGLAADASWQAWIAQEYPAVYRIYLAPPLVIFLIFVVLLLAIFVATGGSHNIEGTPLFAKIVIDLMALAGMGLVLWTIGEGIRRINWIGRAIAVIYLYVMASYTLAGFHGDFPLLPWVECFLASLATESIANWWRRRHPWDD